MAARSSRTTHDNIEAVDSCKLFARLLHRALNGKNKAYICSGMMAGYAPAVREIGLGSFKKKTRDQIQSSGYVVHTLEAALWAFWNTNTFEDGAVLAVNLGHDADTVGAVYGQLAGAFYGLGSIPGPWLNKLQNSDTIHEYAHALRKAAWGSVASII